MLHDLKRRVVLNPDDVEARFGLGEALFVEHQYSAAATQLEKVLAQHPDHGNARRLLVRAYLAEKRLPPAERLLTEAIHRHPTEPQWRDELAEVLGGIGRLDDALLHLDQARALQPDHVPRLVVMAQMHLQRRQPDPARTLVEHALTLAPQDTNLRSMLRAVLLLQGDLTAMDVPPLERGRGFLEGRLRLAMAAAPLRQACDGPLQDVAARIRLGDYQGARRALVTAAVVPGVAADFLKGELFLVDNELGKATRAFQKCVDQDGSCGLAWSRLSELHGARGAWPEARRTCLLALAQDPKDAALLEWAGDVELKLGSPDGARARYREAAAVEPGGHAAVKLYAMVARPSTASEARHGRIHALSWNARGGGVAPVEAVVIPGKGELIFSGNVEAGMQDGARVVFSCIKARAASLGLDALIETRDLHLHFVETEYTIDGRSAGVALFLAAISAYTQRVLPADLAASGEVTLSGAVRQVAGLHEKLTAAALVGIRTVIMPRRNLFDVRELSREVVGRLNLIYVDTVQEALDAVLPKMTP